MFTGGDAILSVIPKNSTAFAVVNGLEMADQVCKELGEATQLPIPSPVMILKQATGLGDSLKMKGNMAVVLYAGDAEVQGPPPMLAVLPIADHKKMLSQFDAEKVTDAIQKITINGNDVLVAEKEGFTIVAQEPDQNVLEAFSRCKRKYCRGNETVEGLDGYEDRLWYRNELRYQRIDEGCDRVA